MPAAAVMAASLCRHLASSQILDTHTCTHVVGYVYPGQQDTCRTQRPIGEGFVAEGSCCPAGHSQAAGAGLETPRIVTCTCNEPLEQLCAAAAAAAAAPTAVVAHPADTHPLPPHPASPCAATMACTFFCACMNSVSVHALHSCDKGPCNCVSTSNSSRATYPLTTTGCRAQLAGIDKHTTQQHSK
jgi:hypothetical protein